MSDATVPTALQAMVDAINGGDTEAFVDAFTPDGQVDDWGRVLKGHEGVRSWAHTDAIGKNARMTVLSAQVDGDVVHIEFDWKSDRFNGRSEAFVTMDGDKIQEFRIPSH